MTSKACPADAHSDSYRNGEVTALLQSVLPRQTWTSQKARRTVSHSRMAKGLLLLLLLPIAVEGIVGAADNRETGGSRREPMCTKRFMGAVDVWCM